MNGFILRNNLKTKVLIQSSIRFNYNKLPEEKIKQDPFKLTSNQPKLRKTAIYSEEEKLKFWKNLNHFELNPTYTEYTDEEKEFLLKNHLKNIAIENITLKKENKNDVDPNDEPYNEIYQDGVDNKNFTKVKNLMETEPQRWFWVDRLKPTVTFDDNNLIPGKKYPSKIKKPEKIPDLPFFVSRTRNCLLPVYKKIELYDQRPKTVISKIDGDIWQLENILRTNLEKKYDKRIITSVNEAKGEIYLLGYYALEVSEHLEELGF